MRERLAAGIDAVRGRAGLAVDADMVAALAGFLDELCRWNRVHNLTAITDPQAMIRRHVLESLALRPLLAGRRIADVGSGAGVPGVPLAIAEPDRHFTLVESRGKRAAFLRHVQGMLGLDNVAVAHCRVEEMNDAGPFDTLLARALAPPAKLLRLTAHLFGPDTVMLALVGRSADLSSTGWKPTGSGPTGRDRTGPGLAGPGPKGRGPTGSGPTGRGRTGPELVGSGPKGRGPTGSGPIGRSRSGPELAGCPATGGRESTPAARFDVRRTEGVLPEWIDGALLIVTRKRGR